MLTRFLQLSENNSFFLFGARGTGKSTLIRQRFGGKGSLYINLLLPEEEEKFARDPQELLAFVTALPEDVTHVVLDEIQKIPKLLDVIHELIETTDKIFIMTGSSARKLKHGGANLLAGRAFVYHFFPFSWLELKEKFNLNDALSFGMLPKIWSMNTADDKKQFLRAYTYTYLKEEVWSEQLIRQLDPFRRFLEVAAQCNGKIINYSNISRDVGVDDKTVREYFSILEDTLLGFVLEPWQHSFRKRLSLKPKFYFFDVGVTRALANMLTMPLNPRTSYFGELFEHFVILECKKLASYFQEDFRFSYLKTKDDAEIDLIVERPGQPLLCIEIKSSTSVRREDLRSLMELSKDLGECEAVCFSMDSRRKKIDGITVFPWQEGIRTYFYRERA